MTQRRTGSTDVSQFTYRTLSFMCVALLTTAAACGGDPVPAGTSGVPEYEVDEQPVLRLAEDRKGECENGSTDCFYADPSGASEPNLDCLGEWDWPEPGDEKTYSIRLEDFQTAAPVKGACVNVYLDNMVPAEDECSDEYTTADDGTFTFDAPEKAVVAYRVFGMKAAAVEKSLADSVELNFNLNAVGDSPVALAVSTATLNLIPAVLQLRRASGSALIGGSVRDCDDKVMFGARILVYTTDGELVAEGSAADDPHYRYFDSTGFPSAVQPWTHVDGFFAAINIPSTESEYLVAVWGRTKAGGKLQRIACERVPALPNALTLSALQPRRSTSPDCPDDAPKGW